MKKIENLENLRVFCEIVETGSAREACEKLHIEPSNLNSRSVSCIF